MIQALPDRTYTHGLPHEAPVTGGTLLSRPVGILALVYAAAALGVVSRPGVRDGWVDPRQMELPR